VDTFWTLIQGWRRLVEELDHTTSFSAIREAGKKYGQVMGKNAARSFALLLTAAIGQTAASFSAKVPTLPGSAQASVAGTARVGIQPTAVAATTQSVSGAASRPVDVEGPEHHIASDKFSSPPWGHGSTSW
jgi:hypothetical protein